MEPAYCRHQHIVRFRSFIFEAPLRYQVCDHCGDDIRLSWLWWILGALAKLPGPVSVMVIFYYKLGFVIESLIFITAWGGAYVLLWLITQKGQYVLKKTNTSTVQH